MIKLTQLYIKKIVRLHGVPTSIISYQDPRFTSRFWKTLEEALGIRLSISSAYHLKIDGQSKRTIQSLEDLLRIYVLDHLGGWDEMFPLIEFTYNNYFIYKNMIFYLGIGEGYEEVISIFVPLVIFMDENLF